MPQSHREQDDNGFLMVRGCPISSFGIFEYSAAQVGLDGDPNRIVKVFRPESAVSNPETIESFKNVPFIVDHEMLSGFEDDDSTESPDDYGVDGVLTQNVYYEKPWMAGDIKIFSRRAQKALNANIKDLSLGYSCDFEYSPGVFNGQKYEVVQTNMRGNHIALVKEGRVPGARVLDGRSLVYDHLSFEVIHPKGVSQMAKVGNAGRRHAKDSNAVAELKALLTQLMPALQQFLSEEQGEPEHQGGSEGGAVASEAGSEGASASGAEGSASSEVSDPNAADPNAQTVGEEDGTGESGLSELIAQVEQVLAKLKASNGASAGEGANGEGSEGEGTDTVEGLNNGESHEVDAGDAGGEHPQGGKASPGPSAGLHAGAQDAAVRRFYDDLAAKNRLYDRLSAAVGAFDCAAMDAAQVAAYGVKHPKIGLKGIAKGQEAVALDSWLTAREAHERSVAQHVSKSFKSADAAVATTDEMDAYLKG